MSYIPTEWLNGDVITAEKLNKIENGIADIEEGTDTITQDVGTISQQVRDIDNMLSTATCDDMYPNDMRVFVFDGTGNTNYYRWLTLQELVDILPPSPCDE